MDRLAKVKEKLEEVRMAIIKAKDLGDVYRFNDGITHALSELTAYMEAPKDKDKDRYHYGYRDGLEFGRNEKDEIAESLRHPVLEDLTKPELIAGFEAALGREAAYTERLDSSELAEEVYINIGNAKIYSDKDELKDVLTDDEIKVATQVAITVIKGKAA